MERSDHFSDSLITQNQTTNFKRIKNRKKNRSLKRQRYLARKTRRVLKKRARRKDWERHGRKRKDGKLIALHPKEYIKVEAPENFSLLDNPEGILSYFNLCRQKLAQRNQIEFDLSKITNLKPDAIALMIANVKDIKFTHGLNVRGANPEKEDLNKIFVRSRFMEHVQSGVISDKNDKNKLVHKTTNNKVENELAKEICELAVYHTFGELIKFRPIYEIII